MVDSVGLLGKEPDFQWKLGETPVVIAIGSHTVPVLLLSACSHNLAE
jgi:hypothetical protein